MIWTPETCVLFKGDLDNLVHLENLFNIYKNVVWWTLKYTSMKMVLQSMIVAVHRQIL